jgi:hypothetical protein
MEEVESKQLLLNKIAELEKQLDIRKKKEQKFSEYVRESRFYANIPHDQFAHQTQIVRHPGRDPEKRSELLDPDVILSNIQDSRTLFLLQRDFLILHRFYDMGMRSDGIKIVWESRYHPWVGQVRMTSAYKGGERRMQSFLEPSTMPSEGFTYLEKRKAKKEQKGWQRFLKPQDEGNIYE